MVLMYPEEHLTCNNYVPSKLDFGCNIFLLSEGEVFKRNFILNNVIVILSKGEIEI